MSPAFATRYPGDLYPDGWTIDDSIYGYGAPVSALALNDNAISADRASTEMGELAAVDLRPVIGHFVILNEVVTDNSNETHIHVSRAPGIERSGAVGHDRQERAGVASGSGRR